MDSKIALAALLIVLALVNWSIAGKEKHLAEGKVVYLELAPRDPRSLMQGDYMALRFRMANDIYDKLPKSDTSRRWRQDVEASDGYVVVQLDERGVGTFARLQDAGPVAGNEVLMRYRVRNGMVKFATNAFFFQEGHGKYYERARFGQFRVDKNGELLLAAMVDQDLQLLKPDSQQ